MAATDAEEIADLLQHPIGFTEIALEMPLYEWQDRALAPLQGLLDAAGNVTRTKITVAAPNGSGKSQRVVAAAALYWVSVHKRGRVVITTADGKQLNEQIYPSLTAHRARFPGWKWVTSPNIKITTPTGGTINAFTTDDPGRAEGWHMEFDPKTANFDGPLLIIVDEAKSVPEGIFAALDRCGYNAILYVSSPGVRAGRFYESHTTNAAGFTVVQAGLTDCPHISQAKIDDIIATYGPDAPFTRSTLYGEFMDSEKAQRFDAEGLVRIKVMAGSAQPQGDGQLVQMGGEGPVSIQPSFLGDSGAWLRWWRMPEENQRHLIFVDVATGAEQQKGSANPDRHSVVAFRESYLDAFQQPHNPAITARIIAPCHSSLDILADRINLFSLWLGGCPVAVEVNGPGLALIELLKARHVLLYERLFSAAGSERAHSKPGWQTNSATKPQMITSLATLIREDSIDIFCPHISSELHSFVKYPDGHEAAEVGCHDDDVIAVAGAVQLRASATPYHLPKVRHYSPREIRERLAGQGRRFISAGNS